MNCQDTIFAPATTPGSGAIAIIRISGPEAFRIVDSLVRFKNGTASLAKGYTLKRGMFAELDDIVAAVFRSPNSYTGEDSVEIYCHSSVYIVGRMQEMLSDAGARPAEPGEFTRRAFLNGKMDLSQAEAVADVIASRSAAQHRIAMNQLRGGYSRELREIRAQLLELSALMELELDFSEEDVEFADRSRLAELLASARGRCERLADSFRTGNALKNGVPVAIAGAPNSGKSTLLNALLRDERAIVSDIPGTTRDTIEETCVLGGVLFRFIDTAGIRDSDDSVEKMGIERSFAKIREADIVIGVLDGTAGCRDSLMAEAEAMISRIDFSRQKLVLAVNKCDRFEERGAGSGHDNTKSGFARSHSGHDSTKSGFASSSSGHAGSGSDSAGHVSVFSCPDPESAGCCTGVGGPEAVNIIVMTLNKYVSSYNIDKDSARVLSISAKTGTGLDELEKTLPSLCTDSGNEELLVTSERHAKALRDSADSLGKVSEGLSAGIPSDLLAEDLRDALTRLGSITGEISTDEVLGEIFARFCIGK